MSNPNDVFVHAGCAEASGEAHPEAPAPEEPEPEAEAEAE